MHRLIHTRSTVLMIQYSFALLLLVLLLSGVVVAQTPQFSTPANLSGSNSFPMNSATNKIQLQYEAGEFTGSYAGQITRVYLQRSSATAQSTYTNLTISLAQTSTWPTSTTAYYTPLTQCYYAATTIIPAGAIDDWVGITLSTPFTYNPTQHLIVVICQEGYSTGFSLRNVAVSSAPRRIYSSGGCAITTPTGNGAQRYNFGFDLIAAGPMTFTSCTTIQPTTTPVGTGSTNQEIIGMQIVTSGGLSPFPATSFTVNTTGSTSTSNMTAARVYYTGSSATFAATNQFGSTVNNPSGSFTVNGTQTLSAGNNYFWLAYDISLTATATHVVDAQCTGMVVNSVARVPTVTNPAGSRTIIEVMNGIYTINPTGSGSRNFTSFTNAINAMIATGISGAVTFNVAAATYTEALTIPAIVGASSTNTITFNGGTGNAATRILTHSTPLAYDRVVTLDGADYVRFKNLTVRPTNTTNGYGFLFTNSADYNEISSCVIEMPGGSTSAYHIGICANATGSYSTSGDYGNYNLIQDNTITGGGYGVRWYGSSSTDYTTATGNQFIGNTITDWYSYGMYLYNIGGQLVVKDNRAVQRTTGTFTTSSGYAYYIYYPNNGPDISYNYGFAAYSPLYIYRPNYYYASTSNRAKVYNNMGATNGTSTNYGLYVSYPRYTDCVYNTVFMKTTGTAYGLYCYGETTAYDNKFANNWIVLEGNGSFYAQYQMTASSSVDFSLFDNNAFYRFGTGTDYYYWQGTNYSTLAAMKAASPGFNQNSVYGNPFFVSATDVHSRSTVGYQAGVSFPGITDDFDGQPRGLNPCIGADEYPQPPPEFDLAIADVRLDYADNNWARLEGAAMNTVDVVLQNAGLSGDPTGITVVYKVGGMPANETDGVAQVFNPAWVAGKSKVTFTQKLTGLAPSPSLTVYARAFWVQDMNGANNSGSDSRKIDLEKIHGNENFNSMLSPAFTDYVGFLDYPWMVQDVNGGATWRVANGVGISGSNALEYPGDSQAGNDWVFTPGAFLMGGASYRIAFQAKSVTGAAQKLEIAYGMSPDPGSMTTFATFSNFTNMGFLTAKQIAGGMDPYFNTPDLDGLYYLGFRVTTNSGAGSLVLDDIVLDDNPSPPPKIAFGFPGDPLNTFIDTPAKKIQIQANYKAPGLITRTFQVASMTNIYGFNGDFLWDVETTTPWIALAKATPDPTMQGYNLNPPRPRQFQDFTMTVNPAGLAPGLHVGQITFYGILFNDDFPPPGSGLVATNEPLTIDVELRIVNAGSKGGAPFEEMTRSLPMTAGNTYPFVATGTGNPIATIEVTSGVINSMTIRVYPNQLPLNLARMLYVKRYWQITHTGAGWTANITFPYTDQEAMMVNDRNQLRGVRQAVLQGPWEDPIMGTSSASDPAMSLVKVFDFNELNIGGNIALAQPYFAYGKIGEEIPSGFGLEQNYPNPFNPNTTVTFNVAEDRAVRIVVYNSLGMEVAEVVNDLVPAGRYSVDFDASSLSNGTYLYRMTAGDVVQTRQMVLSK